MQSQCLLLCFLALVICQGTETVLDLFPEYKIVQRRIDALENDNKALKVEIAQIKDESFKGNTFVRWGRQSCDGTLSSLVYKEWTKEYAGFLVSSRNEKGFVTTEYVCADKDPEFYGSHNYNHGLIHFVEVKCGSIPCSKYEDKTKLSCVVCSK
ncbi:unnamed protein product [Mytilus edulis]|uniref:Uncharacterized protein n=1 Tax=Mytilus edulis TaxID=6550 RepID=A0A8S3RAU9_MYTED|nr:unnamed protein product [Mytilus edulis]